MLSFAFAIGSIVVGVICFILSRNARYQASIESKYGEAAAQKMARSLRIWGYFLLIASALLILALFWEGVH